MDQPKTRQEKGKGKDAKYREVFSQKHVRMQTARLAAGLARAAVEVGGQKKGKNNK
jgi:hypothetical protein